MTLTHEGTGGASLRTAGVMSRLRRRWLIHLLFGVVVAVLAVVWAGQRAARGVRDELDARLRAAGAGANAGLLAIEADQLSLLRSITFTDGVGNALARSDVPALDRRVTPLQANSAVPMVDVLRPDGRVVFAVRSKGAPAPVASRAGMTAISYALNNARGSRGGRLSQLVVLRTGAAVVTAGPVIRGEAPVGVVLVMTPLADALGRLGQETGATLTAYDRVGRPLATTSAGTIPALARRSAGTLIAGGSVDDRSLPGSRREALGRLVVEHEAAAVLGVSLPDDSWRTGRAVMGYAALGLFSTVLVLSTFILRAAYRRRP